MLPPIARLTPEQAMYHFLSGYTAKVAGTERGRHRAEGDLQHLLRRAVPAAATRRSTPRCWARRSRSTGAMWLVNTGWTGGPYGVGQRMKLGLPAHGHATLAGELEDIETRTDPIFGLDVPVACPQRPHRDLTAPHVDRRCAYDRKAGELARGVSCEV